MGELSVMLSKVDVVGIFCRHLLTVSRISLSKGHLPHLPHRLRHATPDTTFEDLGAPLKFQLACQDLVTRCTTAVAEFGLNDLTVDSQRALSIILKGYDEQLDILEDASSLTTFVPDYRSLSTWPLFAEFTTASSRLNMNIFHIYNETHVSLDGPLARLLTTACTTLDLIEKLCSTTQTSLSPPYHVAYSAILACCCIIRIINTPASSPIDVENATKFLALGINRVKLVSVHPNDMCAKGNTILAQLSKESNIFKHPDGSPDLTVRVRNRLAGGVILDTISRWFDLVDKTHTKQSIPDNNTHESKQCHHDHPGIDC